MKKLIIVSVIMALALFAWGSFTPSHAQDPAKEEKPTFYRLIPGTYVNGWPRFIIHYPKDWIEKQSRPGQPFMAAAPGPVPCQTFAVAAFHSPRPLEKYADLIVPFWRNVAKDVTVVSDKPSQLRDGTPAREVEIQMVRNDVPLNMLYLVTKKGDLLIHPSVGSCSGKIGEDLKAILYSLQFEPGKDEPVKVPPDIQEFFNKFCSDMVSHDIAKVMTHFSDKFLESGVRKGEIEQYWRQYIGTITSYEICITDFEAAGDRVYLAGFVRSNRGKNPLMGTPIIKESGEWKWYGNQRNPAP
jgi:hypothetical protein